VYPIRPPKGKVTRTKAGKLRYHNRFLVLGEEQLRELARGNMERHLGDVTDGNASPDSIYDEAYTLAFDALKDSRACDDETCRRIAQELAQGVAQP
jgi:hypothetical protein